MKILGSASYVSKNGKRFKIEGAGSLPDELEFKSLSVEGDCSGDFVVADKIRIEGNINFKSIRAAHSIDVEGIIKSSSLESGEIDIESQSGKIENIDCKRIKIHHKLKKSNSRVHIGNINAERVDLQNCEVEVINCKDAFIRVNCIIEKLIVEGECDVADGSTVKSTIRK